MCVVQTFERWQQSAEDCLHIFVHGNVQLTRVSDTHACTLTVFSDTHMQLFPFFGGCCCVVKSPRKLLAPVPATVHCGQRYDCKAAYENTAYYGSIISVLRVLAYFRVLVHLFGREISLGTTCSSSSVNPLMPIAHIFDRFG